MDDRCEGSIMIHREATIKYKGYDPNDLKPKSNKRVCCVCDKCGRVSWHRFDSYRDLCNSCSHIGIPKSKEWREKISKAHIGMKRTIEAKEKHSKSISGDKNYGYGKPRSEEVKKKISESNKGRIIPQETREKMSCAKQGIEIEDFNGFVGRHSKRFHVSSKELCLKINDEFFGSHAHHITKSIIIFIPAELHKHIKHNMKIGYNMGVINILALQYLNGCYNE